MSLERLAKVLDVDEVKLMHGSKGVAAYVRIDKSWHVRTVDKETFDDGGKMVVLARTLSELSDEIHKSTGRRQPELTKSEPAAESKPGLLSWRDVGGFQPWDNQPRQQQVQRVEPQARPSPPPETVTGPAVSVPMASRFHAIMAELKDL